MLSPIQKVFYHFSLLTVFAALAIIVYVGFQLLYPVKVIEFKEAEVLNPVVKAGDNLVVRLSLCKYKPLTATLTPNYVDSIIYSAPSYQSNLDVGCREFVSHTNVVPKNLPPGEYYLKVTATYQVNKLRHESDTYETQVFTVVP